MLAAKQYKGRVMTDSSPKKSKPNEARLVTGLFLDRDSAERAYQAVTELGYAHGDVNMVMSDATRNHANSYWLRSIGASHSRSTRNLGSARLTHTGPLRRSTRQICDETPPVSAW